MALQLQVLGQNFLHVVASGMKVLKDVLSPSVLAEFMPQPVLLRFSLRFCSPFVRFLPLCTRQRVANTPSFVMSMAPPGVESGRYHIILGYVS
jgi:hypothetical protein